jgi:hypothetical protein
VVIITKNYIYLVIIIKRTMFDSTEKSIKDPVLES